MCGIPAMVRDTWVVRMLDALVEQFYFSLHYHVDKNCDADCNQDHGDNPQNASATRNDSAYFSLPSTFREWNTSGPGNSGFGCRDPNESFPRKAAPIHIAFPPNAKSFKSTVTISHPLK